MLLDFFYNHAKDDVSMDRVVEMRKLVIIMRQRHSFDAISRSVDYRGYFTPLMTAPSTTIDGENKERVMELVFFYSFQSATEARNKMTRLSKRSAHFFIQLEASLWERYAQMPRH